MQKKKLKSERRENEKKKIKKKKQSGATLAGQIARGKSQNSYKKAATNI